MTFNHCLDGMKVYEAGKPIELVVRDYGIDESDIIKLASNENPYGVSPQVVLAVQERAGNLYRYPDDSMFELKAMLSEKFGVAENEILIGAGSDQVLELCIQAKCNPGSKVLMAKTTFAMYEIYGKQVGAEIIKTPSHEHKIEEFRTLYKEHNPDIVFLCLPNNPLGECLDKDEVYAFIEEMSEETLVVVDGAYQEYAAYKDSNKYIDAKDVINRFPNVLYTGTFSKAYGLGGMRVGYGFAKKPIMDALYKLRPPFNVTTLSLVAAQAALKDQAFMEFAVQDCFNEMKRYELFAEEKGFKIIPSYTNFITYKFEALDSSDLSQWLLERGVIIRNLKSYGVNGVRITIGTPAQNDRFFEMAEKYLSGPR